MIDIVSKFINPSNQIFQSVFNSYQYQYVMCFCLCHIWCIKDNTKCNYTHFWLLFISQSQQKVRVEVSAQIDWATATCTESMRARSFLSGPRRTALLLARCATRLSLWVGNAVIVGAMKNLLVINCWNVMNMLWTISEHMVERSIYRLK